MPDHVAARIIDLKNSIVASTTEDIKFQAALAFFTRQERDTEKPTTSQLLCVQKMKRCCLQDEGELEPQKFFSLMATMNGLTPWIDPSVTNDSELTSDEIYHALT